MLPYWLQHILAYSGLFPCAVAILRFAQLDRRYLPFLLLVWVGMANDHLSYWMGKIYRTNAPNSNIWFLTEALLLLWLFTSWKLFRSRWMPRFIAGVYVAFWIIETFVLRSIFDFSVWFHVGYAFLSVLMAIQYINHLIVTEQKLSLRNAEFLICVGLVLFNTVNVLSEIFWLYGFDNDRAFASKVYSMVAFINFFTNLIFGFALLWIPRKQVYLQLS
jgi:hypothetical protein